MSPPCLADVLADLPDPRSRHGRRYPLAAVLSLVALGLLMGRKSLEGIARLHRDYGDALILALGFPRGSTPRKSTLSRLLRRIDPAALEGALSRWITARLPRDPRRLSIDGKVLKGSRDGEIPGCHLVSAYAPEVQAVVAQLRVETTTNEHKTALRLLGILPVKDKVVIGDAAFCQRDMAAEITAAEGDYVFVVKDNQSGLQTDVAAGFGFEAGARSIAAAFSP
jgi:hypothetical protein